MNYRKLRTIEMQRLSVEQFHEADKMSLTLILDDVRSMYNVGSVFRTADAFRLKEIYLCGITGRPPHSEIHKTALGAEESMTWHYEENILDVIKALKGRGVTVLAIEQAEGSTKLPSFCAEQGKEYAIVLGNEVKGVRQDAIDVCDGCLEIPQFGTKHSMNVSVTAGIVIYHFFLSITVSS